MHFCLTVLTTYTALRARVAHPGVIETLDKILQEGGLAARSALGVLGPLSHPLAARALLRSLEDPTLQRSATMWLQQHGGGMGSGGYGMGAMSSMGGAGGMMGAGSAMGYPSQARAQQLVQEFGTLADQKDIYPQLLKQAETAAAQRTPVYAKLLARFGPRALQDVEKRLAAAEAAKDKDAWARWAFVLKIMRQVPEYLGPKSAQVGLRH